MKTQLTRDLETTLYAYWQAQGATAVEEVTMPDDFGMVDTLVRQKQQSETIWRCFELKVTKADFHSHAQLSFVGHYNYFVLTQRLYKAVAAEISAGIGVLVYQPFSKAAIKASAVPVVTPGTLTIAKPARRQTLQVPEDQLTDRFIASLNREVVKAKQVAKGLGQFSTADLFTELRKRTADYDIYHPDKNLYDQFVDELNNTTIAALQEEIDALTAELATLKMARLS